MLQCSSIKPPFPPYLPVLSPLYSSFCCVPGRFAETHCSFVLLKTLNANDTTIQLYADQRQCSSLEQLENLWEIISWQSNPAQMGICFLKIPYNSTLLPRPSLVCHLVDIFCPNWVAACPEALSIRQLVLVPNTNQSKLALFFFFFSVHGRDLSFFQELP